MKKQLRVGSAGAGESSVHEELLGAVMALGAAHKKDACGCGVRL